MLSCRRRVVPRGSSMEPDPVRLQSATACRGRADGPARAHRPMSADASDPPAAHLPLVGSAGLLRIEIRSFHVRLCLNASYKMTAAAIAEFKDSTVVLCGIRSTVSQ